MKEPIIQSDIYQLLPEDFMRYIGREICDIYYFITSDVSSEERFKILKSHDTPNDYTYFHSDEDNYRDCVEIIDISKVVKAQCVSCGIPYFETACNREAVLKDFVSKLIKDVNS